MIDTSTGIEIIVPSFSPHARHAEALFRSAERFNMEAALRFVISKEDLPSFNFAPPHCLVFFENLLLGELNVKIAPRELLNLVGKFRFQAFKKLLGVHASRAQVCLILDSESEFSRPVTLTESLERIVTSFRDFSISKNQGSLQRQVMNECDFLLNEESPNYFFDSYNWFYRPEIVRQMFRSIEALNGRDWIYRKQPLFECQLYFQYVYKYGSPHYEFVNTRSLLETGLGKVEADRLIANFERSPYRQCGVFEYLNCVTEPAAFRCLFGNPSVQRANLFCRIETASIGGSEEPIRAITEQHTTLAGFVSMHRNGLAGRVAIVVIGRFNNLDQVWNARALIDGIQADVFVITSDSPCISAIREVLKPKRLVVTELQESELANLEEGISFTEENLKPSRNRNSLNMLNKLHLAGETIRDYEMEIGREYTLIIRVRPDIFALETLSIKILETADRCALEGAIFFPNRMFSQGVNDQLFFGLRDSMMALFDALAPSQAVKCRFFNPEWILAETVIRQKLKIIAFEFEYILAREGTRCRFFYERFGDQERLWWSRTIPYASFCSLNREIDNDLETVLAIAHLRETAALSPGLNPVRVSDRGICFKLEEPATSAASGRSTALSLRLVSDGYCPYLKVIGKRFNFLSSHGVNLDGELATSARLRFNTEDVPAQNLDLKVTLYKDPNAEIELGEAVIKTIKLANPIRNSPLLPVGSLR